MMECLKIARSRGRFFSIFKFTSSISARVEGSEWYCCHRVVALMLTCPNPVRHGLWLFLARAYILMSWCVWL